MIVKCIRCGTEFTSKYIHTHVCPNCHFVFAKDRSGKAELEIVRSPDLVRQGINHRLHEESEEKCAFHPDADALAHCKSCGKSLCYACAIETDLGCLCESCTGGAESAMPETAPSKSKEPYRQAEPAKQRPRPETVSVTTVGIPYVAWEYRRRLGRLNALFATWQQSLFTPLRFFQSVQAKNDYRSPLLYGLFWALVGLAGGVMWRILLFLYPTITSLLAGEPLEFSFRLSPKYIILAGAVLLSPLFAFLMLMGACITYHIFVIASTGRHAGFRGTLRVVCYSTGTNIFYFVPLLGGLIGGIWQFVLVTVGLKEIHNVSFPVAVTMTIVPYTLLLIPSVAFMVWAVAGTDFGLANLVTGFILSLLRSTSLLFN